MSRHEKSCSRWKKDNEIKDKDFLIVITRIKNKLITALICKKWIFGRFQEDLTKKADRNFYMQWKLSMKT